MEINVENCLIWSEENHIKYWIKHFKHQIIDGYDVKDLLKDEEKKLEEHYKRHKAYYDGIPYNN